MLQSMATLKLSKSQIFESLWIHEVNKREQETGVAQLTLEEVATLVWQPVKQRYDDLRQCIQDGSITLKEVDSCLNAYVDNYSDLNGELQLMSTSTDDVAWVERRVHQAKLYHQLRLSCVGATLIMEAKEAFNLTGDFSALETIVNAVRKLKVFKRYIKPSYN